jgi:DNA mismatch endonuclease (patch repair protein)
MADVLTKKQRSYNMSQIRGKDTKPEEIVRKYLFSRGLRYRKNDKRYPGHPDIVLPKYHTVVFVHGCFWHRHPGCRYASVPATNSEFWQKKFARNVERDKEEQSKLKEMGWKVLIVWECELKKDKRETTLSNLYSEITGE